VRDERAIRPAGHDVGEGAAAVDPELPAPGHYSGAGARGPRARRCADR
jgi:hypothetical protein